MNFVLRFVILLLMSLVVGTMFGVWIGFDPSGVSAATYVEQQQHTIRALNTLMPALGAACIALAAALAVRTRSNTGSRYLLIAAIACLVVAGLVTRFANQPINAQVMTWSAVAPPANWMELRDMWWHWHILRTVAGIAALSLTLLAVLAGGQSDSELHS